MNDDAPDVAGRWHPVEPTTPGQEAARALSRIGTVAFGPVLRVLPAAAATPVATPPGSSARCATSAPCAAGRAARRPAGHGARARRLGARRDSRRRAVDPLTRSIGQDDSADVRQQSAWALGAVRDERAVDALLRALKDRDHGVRKQSASGAQRRSRRTGHRRAGRRHGRRPERSAKQAVWAMGAIGDARAVTGVAAALEDKDDDVRHQAAWALRAIRDARAIEPLLRGVKDPRERSAEAGRLGPRRDS